MAFFLVDWICAADRIATH